MEDDGQAYDDVQHIILFYKYHALSTDFNVTEAYRQALEKLCRSLGLTGRILVGCSKTEGINGTLAGKVENVQAFTRALLGQDADESSSKHRKDIVRRFRIASKEFFESIGEPELMMGSPDDFKWSRSTKEQDELFPDLNIKLVSEIIGTGGVLSSIPLEETARGYLSPNEWHEKMTQLKEASDADDTTVLIDCRNTKEYEVGRFDGATEPKTTTFAQFPQWVRDNQFLLHEKEVYMYCTGGIRCEKASWHEGIGFGHSYLSLTLFATTLSNLLGICVHSKDCSFRQDRQTLERRNSQVFGGVRRGRTLERAKLCISWGC